MPTQHRILSLVYNDFEALDLFGPLGAIIPRSDYYSLELVNLHNLDSPHGIETSIKNGIGVIPTLSLVEALREDHQFDTLFIPGGFGMLPLIWDPILLQRIGKLVDRAANVFTVCTGSILLAATGRLDGRKATTNKRLYDELTPKYPGVQWQKRARWVQDGKFLTSSGVTAGIDAGFAFMANTYVAPEDRQAHPEGQKFASEGEETSIPGFNKEKALHHAHFVAFGLEYRWHSDPADDPFVDLPGTDGKA
ncbi:putative ThiJ/PfpI family transcriptional regulator [Aspergillus fischeri NRRL 181]|uniref:DJ-1/PfpI family protein n=1 Tax=Neosartorya fischeri (strain ATCC 1020 / DSM 3700 / CBS 544.65 / FGSC A1164 / JCM 1740 / NRRL 181 / WB 181) TaxID=331117 RepID=A1DJW4_NEOFI|nr:DJ-1/PfpI family protein [Aspergillus fischeri NRRL 181]EAW17003.1 DJ-1/PfpI family protein [Aspergillus fischeri NRRL 181]